MIVSHHQCLLIGNPFCESFAYYLNASHFHTDVFPSIGIESEREREEKKNGEIASNRSIHNPHLFSDFKCYVCFSLPHLWEDRKWQKNIGISFQQKF